MNELICLEIPKEFTEGLLELARLFNNNGYKSNLNISSLAVAPKNCCMNFHLQSKDSGFYS